MSEVDSQTFESDCDPSLKWHQKFARQQFQGWRPILNIGSAQIFFVSAGIFCIALGIPILTASLTVTEYSVRYDNQGPFGGGLDRQQQQDLLWNTGDDGVPTSVQIHVDRDMQPPIYLFYRLGSFFQNYRRYVRSLDSSAMHDGKSGAGASACDPFRYQGGAADASLPNDGAILPCGQIAFSNFNDSYSLSLTTGGDGPAVPIELDESNLAWSSDRNDLYGPVMAENYNVDPDFRGGNTTTKTLDQSEHWMVWMKPGGSVPVYKLYGRINTPIPAGSVVTVDVTNRYNTYEFQGSKTVILTTNSWVGGKNNFLGAAYLVTGGLCFIIALVFFLAYNAGLVKRRKYGDLSELSWLLKHDGTIRPDSGSASRLQAQVQPVQVLTYQADQQGQGEQQPAQGGQQRSGGRLPKN